MISSATLLVCKFNISSKHSIFSVEGNSSTPTRRRNCGRVEWAFRGLTFRVLNPAIDWFLNQYSGNQSDTDIASERLHLHRTSLDFGEYLALLFVHLPIVRLALFAAVSSRFAFWTEQSLRLLLRKALPAHFFLPKPTLNDDRCVRKFGEEKIFVHFSHELKNRSFTSSASHTLAAPKKIIFSEKTKKFYIHSKNTWNPITSNAWKITKKVMPEKKRTGKSDLHSQMCIAQNAISWQKTRNLPIFFEKQNTWKNVPITFSWVSQQGTKQLK